MTKQARDKDLRDLEDRFGSDSQAIGPKVSPVMMGHILPVNERPPSPATSGSLFLYPFKGRALNKLFQELPLPSMGKIKKSNGWPIEWGCLFLGEEGSTAQFKIKASTRQSLTSLQYDLPYILSNNKYIDIIWSGWMNLLSVYSLSVLDQCFTFMLRKETIRMQNLSKDLFVSMIVIS